MCGNPVVDLSSCAVNKPVKWRNKVMHGFIRRGLPTQFLLCTLILLAADMWRTPAAQAQRRQLPKDFAAPADAQTSGQLPAGQQLDLSISLPLRNTQELRTLIQQLHDPSSPEYGKYL